MSYSKIILALVILLTTSIQGRADDPYGNLYESDEYRFSYSPPEGAEAEACLEQCSVRFKQCEMPYEQCAKDIGKLRKLQQEKATVDLLDCDDNIDERPAFYGTPTHEQRECHDQYLEDSHYNREVDFKISSDSRPECGMQNDCQDRYRRCYLACGGTVRIRGFELKLPVPARDPGVPPPTLSEACTAEPGDLNSLRRCCDTEYDYCLNTQQRRKLGTTSYTEREAAPLTRSPSSAGGPSSGGQPTTSSQPGEY